MFNMDDKYISIKELNDIINEELARKIKDVLQGWECYNLIWIVTKSKEYYFKLKVK